MGEVLYRAVESSEPARVSQAFTYILDLATMECSCPARRLCWHQWVAKLLADTVYNAGAFNRMTRTYLSGHAQYLTAIPVPVVGTSSCTCVFAKFCLGRLFAYRSCVHCAGDMPTSSATTRCGTLTSAYLRLPLLTSAYLGLPPLTCADLSAYLSAYLCLPQLTSPLTSAYLSLPLRLPLGLPQLTSAYLGLPVSLPLRLPPLTCAYLYFLPCFCGP